MWTVEGPGRANCDGPALALGSPAWVPSVDKIVVCLIIWLSDCWLRMALMKFHIEISVMFLLEVDFDFTVHTYRC